jgi:hypothetical protein
MMSDNVQSAMFEILKSIRADIAELRAEVRADFASLRADVAGLRETANRQRRDIAALLVMMKGTVGVFDERLSKVEHRVDLIEEQR